MDSTHPKHSLHHSPHRDLLCLLLVNSGQSYLGPLQSQTDAGFCYGCYSDTPNDYVCDVRPNNFTFIGSILKEMLVKVPHDNVIVNEYQNLPSSGVRPMPDDL